MSYNGCLVASLAMTNQDKKFYLFFLKHVFVWICKIMSLKLNLKILEHVILLKNKTSNSHTKAILVITLISDLINADEQ